MSETIDLGKAGPGNFRRTRSRFVEALWILVELVLVTNSLQVSSALRAFALRLFGAKIGRGCLLRPRMRVKFPWNLEIGDHCWIGEGIWIHNQDRVRIGNHVVVSQGTLITTGSHEHRKTMDLVTEPVTIEDGVWLTARCIVLKGVTVGRNAVVTAGSVVHESLEPDRIYRGNPATFIRPRFPDDHAAPPS